MNMFLIFFSFFYSTIFFFLIIFEVTKKTMNRMSLFRQYGQIPIQKKKKQRLANNDDLIMQDDLVMTYRNTVSKNVPPVLVESSYQSRTKTIPTFPSDDLLNSKKTDSNQGSDDTNHTQTLDSNSSRSGDTTISTKTDASSVLKSQSQTLNYQNDSQQKFHSDDIKKQNQQFGQSTKEAKTNSGGPYVNSSISQSHQQLSEELSEKKHSESRKTVKKRRSSSVDTLDSQSTPVQNVVKNNKIEIDAEPVLKRMAEPIRNRLTVNLPLNDLNVAQVQSKITLDAMEKSIADIRQQTDDQIKDISDITQSVRDIQIKVASLTQKAELISGKLTVLDDWMDGLEAAGDTMKIQALEVGVKFISYISSLILLIFHSLAMANPISWFRRRKKNKEQELKEESTTDEATDPGFDTSPFSSPAPSRTSSVYSNQPDSPNS